MELKKIVFAVELAPRELIVKCPTCHVEIQRDSWENLNDFNRKRRMLTKAIAKCPYCGERFQPKNRVNIPWEKTKDGDYIAKAKNGDFLVWKFGRGYKCRYRKYGEEAPDGVIWRRTKEDAMRTCELHPEWKI